MKEYYLSELLELKYGKDHKTLGNGTIPCYGSGGVIRYVNNSLYEKESILIPRKGSLNNLFFINKPFWTVDTLFWSIINEKIVLPRYLFYKLKNLNLSSFNEGSAVPSLTTKTLNKISIKIHDLKLQEKIVSILSLLDEKIELNKKINQNLEEIAQTLFKRWFIDFEFPNEEGKPYKSSGGKMIESELGEIPEGWKIKNLLEVGDFINGLAMQKYRPLDTEDSLKVIKIKEMNSGFSKESELCSVNIPDTYKVNFGDILFSWSGTLKVMFWNKECGGLNQHIFKVIPKNVNKLFLYFWLKIHLQTFIQIAQSKATTMGHIKRNDLNNSKIIVPNTEFWIYKEKILNSYLEKIVYQSKEIEKLIELRDYLLPKLMNGEIDVSNLKISKILNSDLSFYLIQFFHLKLLKLKLFYLVILNLVKKFHILLSHLLLSEIELNHYLIF